MDTPTPTMFKKPPAGLDSFFKKGMIGGATADSRFFRGNKMNPQRDVIQRIKR